MGHLLFMVELGTLADVDRLGQEDLRRGYCAAAGLIATDDLDSGGDAATLATLAEILEDRLRRTRLDLADLATSAEAGEWRPFDAVDVVLDAVLTLTARSTPPLVHLDGEEHELTAASEAIQSALARLRESTRQLEDGHSAVERLSTA
jgi:hypothetical protein